MNKCDMVHLYYWYNKCTKKKQRIVLKRILLRELRKKNILFEDIEHFEFYWEYTKYLNKLDELRGKYD